MTARDAFVEIAGSLRHALSEQGASVDFWASKQSRRAEDLLRNAAEDLVLDVYGEEIREVLQDLRASTRERLSLFAARDMSSVSAEGLDDIREALLDAYLTQLLCNMAARRLGDEVMGTKSPMAAAQDQVIQFLRASSNVALTRATVQAADSLVEDGEPFAALRLYRRAVEECPRPELHTELACLFVYRAAVETNDLGPPSYTLLKEWDVIDSNVELLTPPLLAGPLSPSQRRTLLALALDAYGRAFAAYESRATREDRGYGCALPSFLDQCHVLEGLGLTLEELGLADNVRLAFDAFVAWAYWNYDEVGDLAPEEFHRRFGYLLGLVTGKQLGHTVGYAEKLFTLEQEKAAAGTEREVRSPSPELKGKCERRIAEKVGDCWNDLEFDVQRILVDAEVLDEIYSADPDYDWTNPVMNYVRATESLLIKCLVKPLLQFLASRGEEGARFRKEFLKNKEDPDKFTSGELVYLLERGLEAPVFLSFVDDRCPGRQADLRRLQRDVSLIHRSRSAHGRQFGPTPLGRPVFHNVKNAFLGSEVGAIVGARRGEALVATLTRLCSVGD